MNIHLFITVILSFTDFGVEHHLLQTPAPLCITPYQTFNSVANADIRLEQPGSVGDEYYRDQLKIKPKPIVFIIYLHLLRCFNTPTVKSVQG